MPHLEVDNLCKEFATPDGGLAILKGVNLSLQTGDTATDTSTYDNVAVLGPSGSGKSTLLHILGTLDPPTSGGFSLDGENPLSFGERDLAYFRNHNIGFIFQEHHLLPQLSVLENVVLPAMADGKVTHDLLDRASDLIDRVGLKERSGHRPAELSGGERQRAAVARALLMRPKLLLADEPTGSLDRANAQTIGKLLLKMQQEENALLLVVTHSEELAQMLSHRLQFKNGELVAQDH